MGLSDRDYMRDRYRKQGGAASIPVWNDKKGRVEREDVPLGSASWVGKNTEFDEYDRIAMRYGRRRRTRTGRAGWTPALRGLIPILCLVPVAIGILAEAGLAIVLGTPTAAPPPWLWPTRTTDFESFRFGSACTARMESRTE